MDLKLTTFLLICVKLECGSGHHVDNQFDSSIDSTHHEIVVRIPADESSITDFSFSLHENEDVLTSDDSVHVGESLVYLVKVHKNMTDEELAEFMQDHYGTVADYASYNYIVRAFDNNLARVECGTEPCQTQSNSENWGLSHISHTEQVPDPNLEYKWADSNDGSGVSIYIMDSGIYASHTEFSDINVRQDFVVQKIDESEGTDDLDGHGTHVAGVAAGKNYGVAKKADLVAVKVLNSTGYGNVYGVLKGLSFIENKFRAVYREQGTRPKFVVNMSLGTESKTKLIADAIEDGSKMGIIYVAAAGNKEKDACGFSPANSEHAITVASITRRNVMWPSSNYGECVDILAPGFYIKSAGINGPTSTSTYSGTSQAAPFVSGVVARYLSTVNETNVNCVKRYMFETAVQGQAITRGLTVNRILHVGCNTCFWNFSCQAIFAAGVSNIVPQVNVFLLSLIIIVYR